MGELPGDPRGPGDPNPPPLFPKLARKELGVAGRRGRAIGGNGEYGPGEDMLCIGCEDISGVNCSAGVLSRAGRIAGEVLGGDGRVNRGKAAGEDI